VVTVHSRTLYGFVVTSLERRQIVHVGVTAQVALRHPCGVLADVRRDGILRRRAAATADGRMGITGYQLPAKIVSWKGRAAASCCESTSARRTAETPPGTRSFQKSTAPW
jgi:hypothetical protein